MAEINATELMELPTVRVLTEKRRRFVIEYCTNGCNGARAIRDAGYNVCDENSAKSLAYTTLQHDGVQAAIQDVARRQMHAGSIIAIQALIEVIEDKFHKDRVTAAKTLLSRTGFHETNEHKVRVTEEPNEDEMLQRAMALAQKLGAPIAQFVGHSREAALPAPKVEEAEVIEDWEMP